MLKPGDRVHMAQSLKDRLLKNDCDDHVNEFGECVGLVVGIAEDIGDPPVWDVRWQPSNLRYAYEEKWLEIVPDA